MENRVWFFVDMERKVLIFSKELAIQGKSFIWSFSKLTSEHVFICANIYHVKDYVKLVKYSTVTRQQFEQQALLFERI